MNGWRPLLFLLLFCPALALGGSGGKDGGRPSMGEAPELYEFSAPFPVQGMGKFEEAQKKKVGTLSGRVVDGIGDPVAGATVTCIDEKGEVVARTQTDEDGHYQFTQLPWGIYSVEVDFSGFSSPLTIPFKAEEQKRPPIPTGLHLTELDDGYRTVVRASWDRMQNTDAYKCELYVRGERTPLFTYPDMEQNTCEFGGLKENTEYQVRIFSRNQTGYSSSYALGLITTRDRKPPAPFGVGITTALNNVVEIIWNGVQAEDLRGYLVQIRPPSGKYLFYAPDGLTDDPAKAHMVEGKGSGTIRLRIEGRLDDGAPLVENGVPYDFRVLAVDVNGNLSTPSNPVRSVRLVDTVPPSPPYDIEYSFVDSDRIRITWKTRDRDVARFKLYYGVTRGRWDDVVITDKTSYELLIDRSRLENQELYVTITAVDRAGNESGYMPVKSSAEIEAEKAVNQDIVLPSDKTYRDFSVAIRKAPAKRVIKKVVKKKPAKPREYGIEYLATKGYTVDAGETARLTGDISLPDDAIIVVRDGGTLEVTDATLRPEGSLWGGIRFTGASRGTLYNVTILSAATGIAVVNNRSGLDLRSLTIKDCVDHGVYVKDSVVSFDLVTIGNSQTGLFSQDSSVTVTNSLIEKNEKGVLSNNFDMNLLNTKISDNRSYGIRIYGGGSIEKSIITGNQVGAVLEEGRGVVTLTGNVIEKNLIDGVVVSTSNSELRKNTIARNGRNGVYVKNGTNPAIIENDILNNEKYAVIGGGRVQRCYVAYNNGSIYVDDTEKKGTPDDVLSSSSAGVIKQILNVDYIEGLAYDSVL